ncbi:MAG: GNAT family N-acetyltransferase [Candidatus Thorarchaeota archaeon]|nr:GNAT family N-acetyltransferase [Candidatus Thorarchaeota archaeon]
MADSMIVRALQKRDNQWAFDLWAKMWHDDQVVTQGRIFKLNDLQGFVALSSSERVGLLTYHIDDGQLEIVTLDSLMEGVGIGSTLVDHALSEAKRRKCKRVWLITTNDNTEALRFYQRRGFAIHSLHRGAIEQSRQLKPSIPHVGKHGIPIRDEIELEYLLE